MVFRVEIRHVVFKGSTESSLHEPVWFDPSGPPHPKNASGFALIGSNPKQNNLLCFLIATKLSQRSNVIKTPEPAFLISNLRMAYNEGEIGHPRQNCLPRGGGVSPGGFFSRLNKKWGEKRCRLR